MQSHRSYPDAGGPPRACQAFLAQRKRGKIEECDQEVDACSQHVR